MAESPDRSPLEEDVRLMAEVAAGNPRAQNALAVRLYDRIRRVSRSLLGDAADADDATQVGLLEVLGSAGTYRGDAPVERWADRITVRTALRMVRRRRAGASPDAGSDVDCIEAPTPESPLSEAVPRKVGDYLRRIADPLRTVLVLRHVLEYSVDEIGTLLGVSPNTVKDRLLRARRQLRRLVRREAALGAPRRNGVA